MEKFVRNEKGQAVPTKVLPVSAEAFAPMEHTEITWLGSAGVLVNTRGTVLLMDPLLMGFDMPLLFEIPLKAEDIPRVDAYLVTHVDGDHYSRETCAALGPVCGGFHTTQYVAGEMQKAGIPGVGHPIGGKFTVGSAEITLTPVEHMWQTGLPEFAFRTWKAEDCCGFWLDTPDGSVWMPGDSKLLESHLYMPDPDVILFDFSDNEWHITLEGAVRLANAYPRARLLCIHWGTVDAPEIDPFCGDPADLYGRVTNPERIRVLWPGEKLVL